MRYQNILIENKDQHLYTEDGIGEILVIQHLDNGDVRYNITFNGITHSQLTHEQMILKYWDNDSNKPFQKTLHIALDMGIDLMEKHEDEKAK